MRDLIFVGSFIFVTDKQFLDSASDQFTDEMDSISKTSKFHFTSTKFLLTLHLPE